jgi:hypothetical protein
MPAYSARIVDAELQELLASAGAVVIEGPKACSKTMTASQQAASRVLLDVDQSARQVLAVDPGLLLEGARPRLSMNGRWLQSSGIRCAELATPPVSLASSC